MSDRTCSVASCKRPVRCVGLCAGHYSTAQYHKHKNLVANPPRSCEYCGRDFSPTLGATRQRHCTASCRSKAKAVVERVQRQASRKFTHCDWCGADIRHMRADAKFCSDYCSNRCDYRDNRDRIDTSIRRYIEQNTGKVLAARQRYREENRQLIYARQKRWQSENLKHHKAYQREYGRRYALANPEKLRLGVANRRDWKRSNGGGALLISERDWARMLLAYRHRCAYCGGGAGEVLEIEHVVPLSRGGRHSIGNVVPACMKCNRTKNDRLLIEWRLGIPRRIRRRVITM